LSNDQIASKKFGNTIIMVAIWMLTVL